MEVILTVDEVLALQEIKESPALEIKTPAVPKLVALGYVRHGIDGHHAITENGRQALFYRRCFNELLSFSANPKMVIQLECEEWLCRSGHVQRKSVKDQMHFFDFEITQKGKDWIASVGVANG